ncbi:Endo-1,4-beta-xylanase protein [Dioscorea alata]|uniref:Endo-1,4-beta-xylanase protein n=1 Tax=Dioscorea alata TaxID=55571 RepID=A0ACB7U0S0_DIOAL|nr:Endo-1,4-beta-xylanase protein [Dioscorea alata]
MYKTSSNISHAVGTMIAKSGCWSMLKGGISVNYSGPAELYFESQNASIEIWIDSVSLQPFTKDQWRSHQSESINKVRMRKVRINSAPGTKISIKQSRPGFPFGNAISKDILSNTAYQNWFTSRFKLTTFENEMKWYSTESSQGIENYADADAMLAFCKQNGINVRGHNIFWNAPNYQPNWVNSLPTPQLQSATDKRINSIMNRYKGQVIAWDVVNENMHYSFFESKLGKDASSVFYQKAHQIDNDVLTFMNEFNTLESPGDEVSIPTKYLQKLTEIQSFGGSTGGPKMAIGLEGHFSQPNIAYMRSALDSLAAAKVPIWLTEVDVSSSPQQAEYLEEILREAFAHPAVNGIVMWASWHAQGCYSMCLTDNNFKNLPTGDVVDKLLNEWKTFTQIEAFANTHGFFELDLFHGEYEITTTHPSSNSSSLHILNVHGANHHEGVLHVLDVQA